LKEIKPSISKDHLLISIAAGYKIEKIDSIIGSDKRIVRAMPNICAKVGSSSTGFSLS